MLTFIVLPPDRHSRIQSIDEAVKGLLNPLSANVTFGKRHIGASPHNRDASLEAALPATGCVIRMRRMLRKLTHKSFKLAPLNCTKQPLLRPSANLGAQI